jgi:flagellar motor switch protein FliN/FliY
MSDAHVTPHGPTLDGRSMLDVPVRFWAELGRVKMPIGSAVGLAEGSVVDLDRKPEEPVDVYLNGSHFGTGRLIMADGEWALQLEMVDAIDGVEQASSTSSEPA